MNIVITGISDFIAKNLISTIRHVGNHQFFLISETSTIEDLRQALAAADFLYHLAGVYRTNNIQDFYDLNTKYTKLITSTLLELKKIVPIVFHSSTQVELDNDYGKSKKQAEQILIEYSKSSHSPLFIYRLPDVFGKWSQPYHNSVVATFCHQIANELDIEISDQSKFIDLIYIDEVIEHFISCLTKIDSTDYFQNIDSITSISLGTLASKIQSFRTLKEKLLITDLTSQFDKQLFTTFTSFTPMNQLRQTLKINYTENSFFAETIKSENFGQLSINQIEPGAVKGNHWHHSKHEKFLVIRGVGIIRLRDYFSQEMIEFQVNGSRLEWIEILPGLVHNIENVGTEMLVVLMWANEIYDSIKPDTFNEVM